VDKVARACGHSYREEEVRGSWSEGSLDKSTRPCLKNKLKQKGLRVWFKW
jgi:hypothetical protein